MRRVLARMGAAGLALAAVEIALVLAHDRALFLSGAEIARYVVLAPATCVALALVAGGALAATFRALRAGAGGDAQRTCRRAGAAAAAAAFAWAAWALAVLTQGRRLRDLPGRWVAVVLAAVVCAWLVDRSVRALVRHALGDEPHRGGAGIPAALLGVAAVGALALDSLVLRRLYPALHMSLALLAVLATLAAIVARLSPRAPGLGASGVFGALAVLVALTLPLQLASLARAPNARFAIEESAPLTGKLVRLAGHLRGPAPLATLASSTSATPRDTGWSAPGVDLRGRDVLLVTIDALRADRLRAFGGTGVTPRLDELAQQSLVFRRAYTATPHTSYALASLMTSKYVGDIARLGGGVEGHVTLPTLLRAHGYRTAAFYPPSIFFVDGERFGALAKERFGFEYAKVMFADAHARVAQLASYLAEAPPGHPVFAWVHLFEPHEPYDPPPAFARGDSPEARYDGEVATADDATGGLVAAFRRARPDATVIVAADHGEEFGDHGGEHHGTTLFDEQVRVPLLWSSPGVSPGVAERAMESVDIGTTLLAALGVPRDARMRGADLGGVLAGTGRAGGGLAFASIDEARMVTDGRHKAICNARGECRLFDLVADPREREDIAVRAPDVLAKLRGLLAEHVASIAREEALPMQGGNAWPEALARARLGDPMAAVALVPLLGDPRAQVRAAAARAAGELGAGAARAVLSRMREEDADEGVRAEAAVAALALGDAAARDGVRATLTRGQGDELARRAALALAGKDDASGTVVLAALATDEAAEETQRVAAVSALGRVGARASDGTRAVVDALVGLLTHVRLRPEAATALGRIGDRHAAGALAEVLAVERYPTARAAEARALIALGERHKAATLVRRFLGTESSVPDGVALLLDTGTLDPPSSAGADLQGAAVATPAVLRGAWQCGPRGCRPAAGASIALAAKSTPTGDQRVVLRVDAEGAGKLRVAGTTRAIDTGVSESAFALAPSATTREIAIAVDAPAWLVAFAIVPAQPDIPPPPPEPWSPDAGTGD